LGAIVATGYKTGGRKKGTPNRLTFQARLILLEAIDGELEKTPELMADLSSKDRLEILCKLLPYILPRIEITTAENADQSGLKSTSDAVENLRKKNDHDHFMENMLQLPGI
jgi:hypothetical protein